jgi:lipoyl(octanoyl) transferase
MRQARDEVQFVEPGTVDYTQAWQWQREIAEARRVGDGPDTVILLEHPSVYTAGRRTRPEDRPLDDTPVVEVDRGGRITWHGPGQLVGYPIIAMAAPFDVVGYVRLLEQVLIEACATVGVTAGRVSGRSGVWLPAGHGRPERKVAAIGVRVARGITQHGFSLNCTCDLSAFGKIVPCGISDAGVTSLTIEAGRTVSVSQMQPVIKELLIRGLDGRLPITPADIPRPSESEHPAVVDAAVRWHLDPALQG